MSVSVIGIDLGKTVCSVAGLDEAGAVVLRQRVKRRRLLMFLKSWRHASWRWRLAAERTCLHRDGA